MTRKKKDNKFLKLALGVVFDLIGYASYVIPGFAELSDIIWAPISAWLMTKMYKGKAGKIGAVITFVEEALPFTDIVPSFTLMWLYTYVFAKKKDNDKEDKIIDITDMQ
ncbi:hypothetical protein U8527_14085 [Kordia algicida OT-1]|uniref:Uncharacterized protein n=1 Tax=Kordia algicida OT-1 TaxID=391587 RepID=A9DXQ8_9FLAO|nr:hypothetical protein [Kordia algicida]EDP96034.1 hypothetical protein KAOT1_07693 [Kordia algicida OT-1]